jgi:hypothetical protein
MENKGFTKNYMHVIIMLQELLSVFCASLLKTGI